MEVTKTSWDEFADEIMEDIRTADFIAIDTNAEVTGFIMGDESLNLEQLKGAGWYDVLLSKQRTRSPLEFGIAMFKQEEKSEGSEMKMFHVKSYNIPILMAYVQEHDARQEIRDEKDLEERLDIDAIGFEFIQKSNFDLNKSLYDGAPFMNRERTVEAMEYMEKNPDFMVISGQHVTNGDLDKAYFPKLIEKLTPPDMQEIVERLRGIGKFLDVTAKTKVPVIGHNLFLKLILLYKDFVEFLPPKYSEFIPKLEKLLPEFYDTKFVCWEMGENTKASGHERIAACNTKLYPLYRNTAWVGEFSHDFTLHETSTKIYELDLNDLTVEPLEDDPTSFCFECGFDALISGIVFTRLMILATGDFDVNGFPKYAQRWKNRVSIPRELGPILNFHEVPKNDEPVAGHSRAGGKSSNNAVRK